VIEQLQGVAIPASVLERDVLPTRVEGYRPAMLDELTSAGEVLWAGAGGLPGGDGWISLVPADLAPLLYDAAARRRLGGELYAGPWQDVGTVERLVELERFLRENH